MRMDRASFPGRIQTASRHLPFRMRRLSTALPFLVLFRAMNPCLRKRRRFFG